MERELSNLLNETLDFLKYAKIKEDEILWCGGGDYFFSWDQFKKVAASAEYDSGYGAQKVAKDLVIVGSGWWMDRSEYDGSEGWQLNRPIEKPKKELKKLKALTVHQGPKGLSCGWEDLASINGLK